MTVVPDMITPIRFGFLPMNCLIEFDIGKIEPTPEFSKVSKMVEKRLNKDGYLYPPTVKTVASDMDGNNARTIPKTKRPAHLHPVPPSHDLFITPPKAESNLRECSAGFILHLLAFLFRTRLQFADWWFDGRIPIRHKRGVGVIILNRVQLGNYLSHAYRVWSNWSDPEQRRFTNILYMFSRTQTYEWDWEEFVIEYMVLDACWRMGKDLFKFKAKRHRDRPLELCDHFGINHSQIVDIGKIVELRNDLFHETLWHGGRPGHTIGNLGYCPGMKLWMLNEQLIGSFLQLK